MSISSEKAYLTIGFYNVREFENAQTLLTVNCPIFHSVELANAYRAFVIVP